MIAVAAALAAAAFCTPAARADSLVYMKDGNVWISRGDGSNPRQITRGPNTWSWPAEDDSGVILVAGGQELVTAGVEDTAGSEVYRLDQHGASLSTPQQTPGSNSSVGCVTYPPQNLRVAPDGQHFVYDAFVCDHFDTLIGTVGGAGFSGSEYLTDFRFPSWVDDSDFVASRGGVPLQDSDGMWWTHPLGAAADTGYNWFGDPSQYAGDPGGWATGFDGIAVSRDGTKVAALEEDAGNWTDGAARKVVMRLWSAGGAPTPAHSTVPAPTFKCELALPPDPDTTAWFYNAGPTFSPDGTRLAFAEPDGIHIADVSNLDDCASVTAPLVIPGATQPFWSAAAESPTAGYVAPPSPPPPPSSSPGAAQPSTVHGAPPVIGGESTQRAPVIGALTIRPRRFAVAKASTAVAARVARAAKGAIVRYTLSEPARVTFTVKLATVGARKGRRCVKRSGKLRHARRCTLLKTKGTLTRTGVSGANQLRFSGRLGHRKLAPGTYRLEVRATDGAGPSSPKSVRFTIVRR
jgi:hypothetical protein